MQPWTTKRQTLPYSSPIYPRPHPGRSSSQPQTRLGEPSSGLDRTPGCTRRRTCAAICKSAVSIDSESNWEEEGRDTYARPFSSKSASGPGTSPSMPDGTGCVRPATIASRMPCACSAWSAVGEVSVRLGSARAAACELAWMGTLDEGPAARRDALGIRSAQRRNSALRRTPRSGSSWGESAGKEGREKEEGHTL